MEGGGGGGGGGVIATPRLVVGEGGALAAVREEGGVAVLGGCGLCCVHLDIGKQHVENFVFQT